MKTRRTELHRPRAHRPRAGFTLLELLAVISIIAILLALLLPAIARIINNANNAEVSAEFSRLTTGITSFKSDHGGIEPWSSIVLTEDPGTTPWRTESRSRIRRIWPQFNFTVQIDFNGDGAFAGDTSGNTPGLSTGEIGLSASECLVFFLGGMRTLQPLEGLMGFSKNPLNPFSRSGENRETSYFEFDPDQFVDADGDGMLDYMDSLSNQQTPILFVSSNNGQGYSTADGNLNFYVQADGTTPWKPNSFQLISPGEDGEFGFSPVINSASLPQGAPQQYSDDYTVPQNQPDNITNFSQGTLGN